MFPIVLSQARTQNKQAQRTGSCIPAKERTATLTLGDLNSIKKQVTLRSLASSALSPPSSEPSCQPFPTSGSTPPHPDPRLRAPSLPFPGRLQGCTQPPSQKLRWKLSPCSASPSHRGVPPPQPKNARCEGLANARQGPEGLAESLRRAPAPSLAALPGRAGLPGCRLGRRATTSGAPGWGTPLTPRDAGRRGLSHAREIATEVASQGLRVERQSRRRARSRARLGKLGIPAVHLPPNR